MQRGLREQTDGLVADIQLRCAHSQLHEDARMPAWASDNLLGPPQLSSSACGRASGHAHSYTASKLPHRAAPPGMRCPALQVAPGEQVRVAGGHRALGEWDTVRAPKLTLLDAGSNLWSGTVEGLTMGQAFPFK